MIKKLMIALMIAAMAMSCTSKVTAPEKPRPAWVQHLDERFQKQGIAKIVDWRADPENNTIFLWVDRLDTPETCDHVAVCEIRGFDERPIKFLNAMIVNKTNVKKGLTPCEAGYGMWAEYVKVKALMKEQIRKGEGI
jgi:hypothetical protein